jgi:HPt (histidine-containing phosphotransfer) domain-containing protein
MPPASAIDDGGSPPVPPASAIEDELRALRAEYAAELPALLGDLRAELDAARSPEAVARASRKAHRIRGTAGSHGFAEAGAIAGAIEDALDEGRAVPPEALAALAALLAQWDEARISGSSK